MFKKFCFLFFAFFLLNANAEQNIVSTNKQNNEPLPENTLYIELKDGIVIAELFPKLAPMHVQRIKILTKDGFYDNVKFHRVISGFIAQTGDPTGTGKGGSRLGKLYAEFNNEHHTRGTLSMARASDPNSANSQFFIVIGDFFPELDGQYTIFGRVIDGMKYVDKIKVGNTENNGIVENPDTMIKVITGDMLNDKSIARIKEEIKLINKVQNDRLKENPNYQKKSVLDLLVQTKDIVAENKKNNVSNNKQNELKKEIQNEQQNEQQNNTQNVQEQSNEQNINNVNNEAVNTPNNDPIANQAENTQNNDVFPDKIVNVNNEAVNSTPEVPEVPLNIEVPSLPSDKEDISVQPSVPELPTSFEIPSVPDIPAFNDQENDNKEDNKSDNDNPLSGLDDLGLGLPSPYPNE